MLLLGKSVYDYLNSKDKENFKNKKNDNKSPLEIAWSILYNLVSFILIVVPAILISQQCNPNNKVGYGILAFFFPDIYLFQWSLKKFVRKVDGYCPMK